MIYVREDRAVPRMIEFLQTHLFGGGDARGSREPWRRPIRSGMGITMRPSV
jgi:hypothetical protein